MLSKDSDNLTFTITYYTRDRYEAKVEFYFDGVRDDSVTQTSEEEYGLPFVVARSRVWITTIITMYLKASRTTEL